ncbi:unnamed protein product [Peronospora effusa]|uniref:Uncharacterized protein n=2 Tax=Peronospora effusa TaxID=542832 RepID=A0A3R8CL21_9STRA|nr:hypothetical protein DD237_002088 [Peronospora effusa]CAI5719824.1 unnamed protein product [Peronospora effusa]
MALMWSLGRCLLWLMLQLLALALHLAPAAASFMTLTAIVLLVTMTTQALEYSVLTSIHRSKWYKTSSYDDLRRDFYRGYWLLTLLYMLGSILWIYFTDRTSARLVYGGVTCALWWGVQVALVAALTSFDEVITKMKMAINW